MKVVGLVSGGKDGCYCMMECVRQGHEIAALGNLYPVEKEEVIDEVDSFMFQTVGHQLVEYLGEAMEIPLYREQLHGGSVETRLNYVPGVVGDEVSDQERLLRRVKEAHPDIQGVCTGAILSNYQRTRVEYVAGVLGLTCFSYLWQREQKDQLDEMIRSDMDAVMIKVSSDGLNQHFLTKSIKELRNKLFSLSETHALNVCGEGGEYETLTLNCPLYKKRIVVGEWETYGDLTGTIAPVAYCRPLKMSLVLKTSEEQANDALQLAIVSKEGDNTRRVGQGHVDLHAFAVAPIVSENTSDAPHLKWSARENAEVEFVASTSLSGLPPTTLTSLLTILLHSKPHLQPVYCNLSIDDMNKFAQVNQEYLTVMPARNPAARACVQAYPVLFKEEQSIAVLTADMAFAKHPGHCLHVQGISKWAPANIGPYAQGWKVGSAVVFAGQIGLYPASMSYPSDPHTEFTVSMLNALKGVEGFYASKKQITSIALFVSVQSLFDETLPFKQMDLVQEMHKVITEYTPIPEEDISELYPVRCKCSDYFSNKYTSLPLLFDLEEISWPAKYAPVTIVTVPVLPRQAHTEVQVVAMSDKVDDYARVSWVVNMEHASLVLAATYSKENTMDITTYILPHSTNLNEVFSNVEEAVCDFVQQFAHATYHYTDKEHTHVDVLRARLCVDQQTNASTVLQAIQSINSPLSTAAIVGVYYMQLNHDVALKEQALYNEYSKTTPQNIQGTCAYVYQLVLTTGIGA